MLRSLFTGVSGVKAHQTKLDVVGNNIANVNTPGYKRATTVFQDLLSQTRTGAMAPDGNRGGVNAQQVGLGVKVGAIENIHTQGPVSYTGNPTDLAIQGDGYFVVRDGQEFYYTRAGNMTKDENNNLSMSGLGYTLQGNKVTVDPEDPTKTVMDSGLSDVNIPIGQKLEAKKTETVGYRCNLDSRVEDYLPMGMSFGDDEAISTVVAGKDASIEPIEGTTAAGFFTLRFDSDATGFTGGDIGFELTEIKEIDGVYRPVLSPVAGGSIVVDGVTYDQLNYDSESGLFRLEDTSTPPKVAWQASLFEMMDYEYLEVEDGADTYKCLAQFNDNPDTGERTLSVWTDDGAGALGYSGLIKDGAASDIALNPNGTFDLPTSVPTVVADRYTMTIGGTSLDVLTSEDGKTIRFLDGDKQIGSVEQRTASVHVTKSTIYDSQGKDHTLETSWEKIGDNNWRWRVWTEGEDLNIEPSTGVIRFNENGKIDTTIGDETYASKVEVTISLDTTGVENQKVMLDFSGESFDKETIEGVTQYGSEYTTKAYYQDGYRMGVLKDFSVSADGTVMGIYDNDQAQALYRIALAKFSNPQGLMKMGDTCFVTSANSGEPSLTNPTSEGAGSIAAASLEGSNVNITDEFTQLIISQRGFQASSRVITTSDQVLEELLNLKR